MTTDLDSARDLILADLNRRIGALASDLTRAEWSGARPDDTDKQRDLDKLVAIRASMTRAEKARKGRC